MLDVAWSEILVVLLVASFVIKAEDLPKIVLWFDKIFTNIKHLRGEASDFIEQVKEEAKIDELRKELREHGSVEYDQEKYVLGEDGNLWRRYQLGESDSYIGDGGSSPSSINKKTVH